MSFRSRWEDMDSLDCYARLLKMFVRTDQIFLYSCGNEIGIDESFWIQF